MTLWEAFDRIAEMAETHGWDAVLHEHKMHGDPISDVWFDWEVEKIYIG